VLRGGSFDFLREFCRSAHRYGQEADFHYNDVGCRVVLGPD
jgi:formylglycine-generating enzyme required for sulfatase activity